MINSEENNKELERMYRTIGYQLQGATQVAKHYFLSRVSCPIELTSPTTLLNKGEIGLQNAPKYKLPSGASQGLVQLAQLHFLPNLLATGPVVMLHAELMITLKSFFFSWYSLRIHFVVLSWVE